MDTVESLLIAGADFVRWAAAGIADAFAWLFASIAALLNPLLSPVFSLLNPVCTLLGNVAYTVLGLLPGWLSLTVVSVLLGIVMLVAFRLVSNQQEIVRSKNAIKANLLALKLYKDDMAVMARTQVRLFAAVMRLQRYVLVPVLWMTPAMVLLLAQVAARHQWRPLRVGEATLLRVTVDQPFEAANMRLETGPGVSAEVGPLPGKADLVWRIRAKERGRHLLRLSLAGQTYEKQVVVGREHERVSPRRPGPDWVAQVLYPIEAPLPRASPIKAIGIEYPALEHWFYGADWWIAWVVVISMLAAFVLRSAFEVTF